MALSPEEKKLRAKKRQKEQYDREHKVIDGVIHKWCKINKHWVIMNNDNFYKNNSNSIDGYSNVCKVCERERSKIYGREHKEEQHVRRINWRNQNLERELEYNKKWREENRLHISEYTSEYFKNNPDKAKIYNQNRRVKNHKINKQEWIACKQYFDNHCAYCGIPLELHKELVGTDFHKEHVNPNGADDLSNCIPSCESCNCRKWEYEFNEWYNKDNPRFSQERYDKIMKWLNKDWKICFIEKKPRAAYGSKKKK